MTTTILDDIVRQVRRRLAAQQETVPRHVLEASPFFHAPTRSLADALRTAEKPAIIAECKKASPSQGILCPDYDVAEIARQYEAAGAAALSVLTEPDFFEGHLEHLALARAAVEVPLLRKDFIVAPYQLVEARAYGADAVLLIAAVLDADALYDLHEAATDLGLGCLVEIYEPHELEKLDLDQIEILGVNNRNLRTFEVDTGHAERVLADVPPRVVRVAESGLRTADALVRLPGQGIDAALIGTAFMREARPGAALETLRTQTRARLATRG